MKRLSLLISAVVLVGLLHTNCMRPNEEVISSQRKSNWKGTDPEALTAAKDAPPPEIHPRTHLAAAHLFEGQGLYAKAVGQYQQALAVDPDCAEAHSLMGILLGKLGQHVAAEQHLLEAVELLPNSAALRNNLGFEYALQERWNDAESEIRNAIALKPDFTRAYINLGMVLCKQGRFDEGQDAFEQAVSEADAIYNLGLMYRSAHRYRDAADAFHDALRMDPRMMSASAQLEQIADKLTPAAFTTQPKLPAALATAPTAVTHGGTADAYAPRVTEAAPPANAIPIEPDPIELTALEVVPTVATTVATPAPIDDERVALEPVTPTAVTFIAPEPAPAESPEIQIATTDESDSAEPDANAPKTQLDITPYAKKAGPAIAKALRTLVTPRPAAEIPATPLPETTPTAEAEPDVQIIYADTASPNDEDAFVGAPIPDDIENEIAAAAVTKALSAPDPISAPALALPGETFQNVPPDESEAATEPASVRLAVRSAEADADAPAGDAAITVTAIDDLAGPPATVAKLSTDPLLEILCEHWLSMNWVFDEATPPLRLPGCENEPNVFTPRLRFNPNWHLSRPGSVLIRQDPFDQVEEIRPVNWEFPNRQRS